MKKYLAPAVLISTALAMPASHSASLPKPGSKCAKAGLTQTVAGTKLTCTKSGTKLTWNKGVAVATKATPTAAVTPETTSPSVELTTSSNTSPTAIATLVKFKNCTEVKASGAAPLMKAKTPELYELNAGLDRDKDGVACES